jgi:protoporphyrinogen oxidase
MKIAKVAIVGAGAAGLAAAYDLARWGHDVTVYEAADYVGGLAGGFKAPGWDWSVERFYHHWFESDHDVLDLIREIDHGDEILFPRPLTAVYHAGKFYALDASLGALFPRWPWLDKLPGAGFVARGLLALRFPGFSLLDTARFGLTGLYLVLTRNWQALERVTANEWLRRWSGQRVYRALWEPLLIGKFGPEKYREVNMAWFWARVHKRSPRLGTFVGGFQAFFDLLAQAAREGGANIRLDTPVTEIRDWGLGIGGSERQSRLLVRTAGDEGGCRRRTPGNCCSSSLWARWC